MSQEPLNPLERRKSVRGKIIFPFKYGKCVSGQLSGDKYEAVTKDLSTGGLSFSSFISFNLEEPIYLEITPPGWNKREIVIGKVVRCQPTPNNQFVIGVQFMEIDKSFQESLGEYVY
jgi:c-di-GMP-binding flagellar brake protein YcgR